MQQYIAEFCKECDYPTDAVVELLETYQAAISNDTTRKLLQNNLQQMEENAFLYYAQELERLNCIAEVLHVHPYTVHLLFFILCTRLARVRYEEKGIDLSIYHASMLDLKWKLMETKRVYGIWGVHCGDWFRPFFQAERFALGRLQFEVVPSFTDYDNGEYVINKGDPVINVHIPSSGPLEYKQVLDSYGMAADFFQTRFAGPIIPFQCDSWLLYPRVNKLLPDGNLRRFTADFEVRLAGIDPRQDDRWRVFNVPNSTPIKEYEETTRLQKRLKKWLLEGNQMGIGLGYFFYGNNGILHHEPYSFSGNDTTIMLF